MKPNQLKELASTCGCEVCKNISSNDYYISYKSEKGVDWRLIKTKFGPKPCQFPGCGSQIHVGQMSYQKTGTGVRCYSHGDPNDSKA